MPEPSSLTPWQEAAIRSYVVATACEAFREVEMTTDQRRELLACLQAQGLPVLALDLGLKET
jgi:hypothetical protein